MPDPAYIDSIMKSAHRLTHRAMRHLYFETYAPVFAKAALILCIFLMGSFAGIWERMGDPFRGGALILAVVFIGRAIWKAYKKPRPTRSHARRRVEHDSNAKHRPLDTLYDRAALSSNLWPVHFNTAIQSVQRLTPSKRRASISPIDPYYLRFLAPFLLMLALMVGYGDNLERLRRALTPTWQAGIHPSDVTFEAWIDPPDYTGRPPIFFKGKKTIEIPEGSELVARLSGAKSAPRLKLTSEHTTRYIGVKRIDPKTLEARTVLRHKSKARWRIGSKIKTWDLNVVADTAPVIKFEDTPKADKRDRLVLNYSFEDDYGVETLDLHMQRLLDPPLLDETSVNPVEIVPVPLQNRSVKRAENRETEIDLTKHIWAGQKVSAILIARDGRGQKTQSDTVYFTVPDKIFIEPLAKAVVEHRNLVLSGSSDYAPLPIKVPDHHSAKLKKQFDTYEPERRLKRAPKPIQTALVLIDAVTDMPAGLFEDPAIYLGLRNIASRLRYAKSRDGLSGIPEDLWSIAIRAEFGVLGTALEEMREAEKSLRDGIARRAPQREIDTLFDRYNASVDRYMEELRKNATVSESEGGGNDPRDMAEIQELLKAIEEANRIGDTEGARKALARLAELLEKLKIELSMGEGSGSGESISEEMLEALEDMADLLGEQRELKDETNQAQNEQGQKNNSEGEQKSGSSPQDGQNGKGRSGLSPQDLAAKQRALQDALDKLAQTIEEGQLGEHTGQSLEEKGAGSGAGEERQENSENGSGGDSLESAENGDSRSITELFKEAQRAMSDSETALESQKFEGASDAQTSAIQALRNAGQALAQAAKGQNPGEGDGEGEEGNPLGQNNEGQNDENFEAEIDPKDQAARSRELLEDLRRRAAEQEREQLEREYLERLLKRF